MKKDSIIDIFKEYCAHKEIEFKLEESVTPYDDTTLFCPAGMQQFKKRFREPDGKTIANIQSCIRLNDLEELGDGTHYLHFRMIGLFSFGELTVNEAIDFWWTFIVDILKIPVDKVTVHSDRYDTWKWMYERYRVPVLLDDECVWSDGEIGGYCTEFYYQGVEIGNIVNTMDKYIDVGFGLERLESIVFDKKPLSKIELLQDGITKIIESGYKPGPQKQGYVLRKLLRMLWKEGGTLNHKFFQQEVDRQEKMKARYEKLLPKNADKPAEWWFDTHGIDLNDIE